MGLLWQKHAHVNFSGLKHYAVETLSVMKLRLGFMLVVLVFLAIEEIPQSRGSIDDRGRG